MKSSVAMVMAKAALALQAEMSSSAEIIFLVRATCVERRGDISLQG